MGKLTCACLNVKIHSKRTSLSPATAAQLGLSSSCVDGFFALQITDAPLDLGGIRIEQPCLVKQQSMSDWIVNKCYNCDMYTHATHAAQGTAKVLVNCSMKSDPTIQERLESSTDFSRLFKIVLPNRNDNRSVGAVGVQSDRFDVVDKQLQSVQERLNSYLSTEETAMENRIKQYEEEQRAAFAELQSKARRDKNALISMILSSQQDQVDDTSPTSPQPFSSQFSAEYSTQSSQSSGVVTSPMSISSVESSLQEPKITTSSKNDFSFLKQPNIKSAANVASSPTPRKVFQPKHAHNDDDLFDMEGLHDDLDSRPFYNSDDENDTDDSNSLNDEGVVPRGGNMQRTIYSSSVPISVPSWKEYRQRNSSIDEDDEDDDRQVTAPDPENMAASISALARSVHTDTSDIFGGRPSRKISVMDMGRR